MTPLYRASSVFLCLLLANCGYFVPPDKSVPRYNSVIGEPRRPEMNPASGVAPGASADAVASPATITSAESVSTQTAEIASNDVPPPVTIVPVAGATPMLARHLPEENIAAQADTSVYPALNTVPQSSDALDRDAAERLARVRAQLEQERAGAATDTSQLLNDAARDASVKVAPMGESSPVVPAAPPVYSAPLPPPATVTAPRSQVAAPAPVASVSVPQPQSSASISMALPPPPPAITTSPPVVPTMSVAPVAMAQPVAVPTITYAPAPNYVPSSTAAAPANLLPPAAQEPITLRPPIVPVAAAANAAPSAAFRAATPPPASVAVATQSMPAAASGGFNPLEGAAMASSGYSASGYANSGYLPASRYAPQRSLY